MPRKRTPEPSPEEQRDIEAKIKAAEEADEAAKTAAEYKRLLGTKRAPRKPKTPLEESLDIAQDIEDIVAGGEQTLSPDALEAEINTLEDMAMGAMDPVSVCGEFRERGEQECEQHPGMAWPHQVDTGDGDMSFCAGPGTPWPQDDLDVCLTCGYGRWAHDAEHAAFYAGKESAYCVCGAPAGIHFRGLPPSGTFERALGEPFECEGFRDATTVDPPEQAPMWRWRSELWEGRPILGHEFSYSGSVALDDTRRISKAMWEEAHMGAVVSHQLTGEVGPKTYKPVRAGGDIIGVIEVTKIKLWALPLPMAADLEDLPLFGRVPGTAYVPFGAAVDIPFGEVVGTPPDPEAMCACGMPGDVHSLTPPYPCEAETMILMADGQEVPQVCSCVGFREFDSVRLSCGHSVEDLAPGCATCGAHDEAAEAAQEYRDAHDEEDRDAE